MSNRTPSIGSFSLKLRIIIQFFYFYFFRLVPQILHNYIPRCNEKEGKGVEYLPAETTTAGGRRQRRRCGCVKMVEGEWLKKWRAWGWGVKGKGMILGWYWRDCILCFECVNHKSQFNVSLSPFLFWSNIYKFIVCSTFY